MYNVLRYMCDVMRVYISSICMYNVMRVYIYQLQVCIMLYVYIYNDHLYV
jgi:hypothetical protein